MRTEKRLIKRNVKLFFADKGLFFTSLITPMILLVLYITFLEKVYRDSFSAPLAGFNISEEILNGLVGGQLLSSLLAVTSITVAFCSNMLMVQDKITGMTQDMAVSPVKKHIPAISYYVATFTVTMIIALVAIAGGCIYLAATGWYMSVTDLLLFIFDTFILVMFGTALSSLINFFLSSQGQISAVGSIVSSVYGFICGAYMPISQFPAALQKVISFLPGTYGTSLLRNHAMRGSLEAMREAGVTEEHITAIRDVTDCNLKFFGNNVEIWHMYLYLSISVLAVLGVYIGLNVMKNREKQ
ncbi:MAG: ABC transporter permease [Ruminococcaceae bacterium]|nr:ABC transporter permease [Oscillospiraceae bacterium]